MPTSEPTIDKRDHPESIRSTDSVDIELPVDNRLTSPENAEESAQGNDAQEKPGLFAKKIAGKSEHAAETQSAPHNARSKRRNSNTQNRRLNRWPRAVARLTDTCWQVSLIAGLLLVALATRTGNITVGSLPFFTVLFVSLPLALGLDAIIAAVAGNTPAKALVGVRASTARGERVGLAKHFKRNYGVWTDGMGMGVLPITLFTALSQFKRVSGRREAIYDERLHLRVRSGSWTGTRATLLLLGLLITPVMVAGSGLDRVKGVTASLSSFL